MSFNNPIVGSGDALIRNAIRSRNYVSGVSGWSINKDGFAEFNNVSINGGELLINDPVSGDSVASINAQGVASFQDLYVVESPTIMGLDFETQWMAPKPNGLKAFGSHSTLTTSTTTEIGLIEVAATNVPNRNYRLTAQFYGSMGGGTGNNVGINIRYTYTAPGGSPTKPLLTSPLLYQSGREVATILVGQAFQLQIEADLPAGEYRFLISAIRLNGTGLLNITSQTFSPTYFSMSDNGPAGLNTAVVNTGSGGGTSPVQTYTDTYLPLWSRAYNGNGTPGSFTSGNSIYQGYNQSDGNGIRKSMVGYDWATIQADLAGASIQQVVFSAYFAHWYNNSGGAARIGYHNYAGGSAPGAYQTVGFIFESAGWPKPGLRWLDLTSTGLGTALKAGTAKGITLGDGASSGAVYYGYANGAVMSNPPTLYITYTK